MSRRTHTLPEGRKIDSGRLCGSGFYEDEAERLFWWLFSQVQAGIRPDRLFPDRPKEQNIHPLN